MTTPDREIAALRAPPRHVRLHRRFRVLQWVLALAAVLPGSCVFALGRAEVATLERLAREGQVAAGTVATMRATSGRSTTYRLTATFTVDGRTYETGDSVPRDRYVATTIGTPIEVTYLREDPATNRIDRVDAERVDRQGAAFVAGALALAAAFGFVWWIFAHYARRALRLARDGHAAIATIVDRREDGRRLRGRGAHYAFRAADGSERRGRSTFRGAVPAQCAPGATAVVLFDPGRPDRSALLASLEQLVAIEPDRAGPPR